MLRFSLVTLLLVSSAVHAEDFDYNFLTFGYSTVDFDDINVDGDGFGVGGSYAINPSFHVFAEYAAADLDFDIDATTLGAGVGYHHGLSDTIDLVGELSYEYIDLDSSFGGADDSGLGLGVGLRIAAMEALEVNVGIQHVDYGDSGDDTGFEAGGLYSFNEYFSLGLAGEWSDDASAYTLSGRFYFDQ